MNKDRKRLIQILNTAKEGNLTAATLKQLLIKTDISENIPRPWAVGPVREIHIRTSQDDVYLDYPEDPKDHQTPMPGGPGYINYIPIVIAKRLTDQRFSDLKANCRYIITIPKPIETLELARYTGPMEFKQITSHQHLTIFWDEILFQTS